MIVQTLLESNNALVSMFPNYSWFIYSSTVAGVPTVAASDDISSTLLTLVFDFIRFFDLLSQND